MPTVYPFEKIDINTGEYRRSRYMATAEAIEDPMQIKGRIAGPGKEVDHTNIDGNGVYKSI